MKRIDLENAMNPVNMAMIMDEENKNFYDVDRLCMHAGEMSEKILKTTMKFTIKATKEEKDEIIGKFIGYMEQLNMAFNRAVGAPESMKLFKVLDKQARYTGNDTVAAEVTMATLATGAGSAVYTLLNHTGMTVNVWETECNIFTTKGTMLAKETYGLGNALRSWKSVMKKYAMPECLNAGYECIQLMPLYLLEE